MVQAQDLQEYCTPCRSCIATVPIQSSPGTPGFQNRRGHEALIGRSCAAMRHTHMPKLDPEAELLHPLSNHGGSWSSLQGLCEQWSETLIGHRHEYPADVDGAFNVYASGITSAFGPGLLQHPGLSRCLLSFVRSSWAF